MNCCVNCFNDKELIGFIYSNSTEQGDCNFCNSKDTQVIDCRELQELFQPITLLFKTELELGIVISRGKLMHQKISILYEN